MTKDLSELSLSRKECPKCGAVWINGKHYFATGASYDGSELDLAEEWPEDRLGKNEHSS